MTECARGALSLTVWSLDSAQERTLEKTFWPPLSLTLQYVSMTSMLLSRFYPCPSRAGDKGPTGDTGTGLDRTVRL